MSNLSNPGGFGGKSVNPKIVCIGCRFSYGEPPFADTPFKSNCKIYPNESGEIKPNNVYFDGGPCPYRLPEKD
ncbi:MAG: hypothetical protein RR581_06170 [Eubacterium sp.]